ncbi:GTP-binding protein [Halobacteriales archaeon QH_10_67_22]|nr:MAG: GTP-binding protein [Halobacteriales archaeon QH_10_67_22]
MSHPFEDLPTTPTAEELLDTAFSRAARAGRAKDGVEAQQSMLQTAANVVSDNLERVVTSWPDFDAVAPFYRELADAIVASHTVDGDIDLGGVDALRQHLSEVGWAGRKTTEIRDEYQGRLSGDTDTARKLRKQAFARIADVVEEVEDDLAAVGVARDALKTLPDIRPDEPTIVVAGYPNVGKSSFVNSVTNATNETAAYPFTTTEIRVGHYTSEHIRYQLVDTPGLLDRPPEGRNDVESQAVSALEHLADCVLVLVDASGTCGYPLDAQLALRDALETEFDVPVLTVCNKSDRSRDVEADHYMSVTDGENVEGVLAAAIEAVGYEPDLPYDG